MMLRSHGIDPGDLLKGGEQTMSGDNTNAKSKTSFNQASQGNLFNKKKENLEDKARITELVQNLEINKQQILLHKMEIRALKDYVIKILEEKHYKATVAQLNQLELMGGNQMDRPGMQSDDLVHQQPEEN